MLSFFTYGQAVKKQVVAVRTNVPPKIDGKLDDACWNEALPAKDFIQIRPDNGKPSTQKSEVKFVYDNTALYVGAMFYDTAPDSTLRFLSKRDNFGTEDYCGVYIDPYNDGQNAYGFFVSCAGVQMDLKCDVANEDPNWNAVWESAVGKNDEGWTVEIKIPYSALRFPKKNIQTWGINIFRTVQRHREQSSWNFVDRSMNSLVKQEGELDGVQNIKPPLRLSFTPYLSTYAENDPGAEKLAYSFKGGLDLKYGISESFTLDMMVIPDFGQVQFDPINLNLTPFEVYYSEKRPFFMEGTELFQRANIFYSRRIGGTPTQHDSLGNELLKHEGLIVNPTTTQLINATKITGKTKSGFSLGFLNAVSSDAFAVAQDSITGDKRRILTQPLTNYNVIVLEQTLKNNSRVSLINTNVARFNDHYVANVTGTQWILIDNSQKFQLSTSAALDQIFNDTLKANRGSYYDIAIDKIKGNFQFTLDNSLYTDTYNPNDLGYQSRNNYVSGLAQLRYNIYKPFWRLLEMWNALTFREEFLYNPREFANYYFAYNLSTTFRNHLSIGFNTTIFPDDQHDYYEPRTIGRVYMRPKNYNLNTWISSDYSKKFALDMTIGYSNSAEAWIDFAPRFRFSNRFLLVYDFNIDRQNNVGYIQNGTGDTIYFGKRKINTITNTLQLDYIFTNCASLSLNVRHYWSVVNYYKNYDLQQNGSLVADNTYNVNNNINYNAFTIDLSYTWQFAPGSELSLVWKNSIYPTSDAVVNRTFVDNFRYTINSPQSNSISLMILFYIDFLNIQKHF